MVVTVLLLGLVMVAVVTDVVRHKIYNWTTYTGIVVALGIGAVDSWLLGISTTRQGLWNWLGAVPFWESVFGLALCGAVMLVCFVFFRGIGGGDVKLIAMIGAFLGPDKGIIALLWTFVLGGCVGLIVLIWRVGPIQLASKVWRRLVWLVRLAGWMTPSEDEQVVLQSRLFLAPSALAAVVIVRFSLISA